MIKFGKGKIALFLACASIFGGKTQAAQNVKTSQTVAAVGGATFDNSKAIKKSKKMSNLTKGLIIGGSALGVGGIIGVTVAFIKCLHDRRQNDDVPLEGAKLQEAKKLMEDALNQDWVIDKSSKCACRVAGHVSEVKGPQGLGSKFLKKENEVPEELDKWVGYHLQEIRSIFNEMKDIASFLKTNGQAKDTKKYEYLIFSCNGRIIKIGIIKSTRQIHDLEFLVFDKSECNCCWSFLLNNAK